MIRVRWAQAVGLESLTKAIRAECSSFLTLPALNSLYLWTGESLPPDWFNTWFLTSDLAQQKLIANRIEGQDRSRFCVVDNPRWAAFWANGHLLPQLPLLRLLETFRQESSAPQVFYGYRLFVSPGSAS
jgi:hypothetical protein